MKQILKRDIEISSITEARIQDAYDCIRRGAAVQEVRRQKRMGAGRYVAVAAVVGLLGISSVTVLAMNGFFEKSVQKEEDTLHYEFEVNFDLVHKAVKMEPGYIPEGYIEVEEYKYDKEGYRQNGITLSIINAAELEVLGDRLDCDNIKTLEETTIQGMEAHVFTIDYDPERVTRLFDKRIYLFNEKEGYVGVIYGGNDISVEELKKVAENMKYTVTDTEVEPVSREEAAAEEAMVQAYWEAILAEQEYGVPQEAIIPMGTAVELDDYPNPNTLLTVENVEILDSIEGLEKGYFFDYENRIAPYLDEKECLKPYKRITLKNAENLRETPQEVSRDEISQKFVKVTLTAENLESTPNTLWAAQPELTSLVPVEEGNYKYEETWTEALNPQEYATEGDRGSAIYFDHTPYAGQLAGQFFYCELEGKEKLEYTLLFVRDEDRLDNLYLKMYPLGNNLQDGEFKNLYVDLTP